MRKSKTTKILFFTGAAFCILLLANCFGSHKERVHMDTGVNVKVLGPHKYQFIGLGKASVSSVEDNDVFKMKKTSCEAAKLQVTQKLDELESDQKHRLFFLEQKEQKYFGDGEYCELTYIYELPPAKKGKDPA
ncbi:hypothetical protein EHQ27_06560 [Leptospira wolffii]|uniref:Lipoprotein n=1 Tax=Leptospira wolffii TaxID=409998 RepID=A0A2M9Z6Z2_9LEPT|nr:hypothetical protein CH371_18875 [Leptospira wolffii]TGK56017.1 hypothetical protein EHQ32_16495 [Leptospira wolffii]TGK72063.1 hypothetical protein EHQ35_11930 [Leptospira wolffii]TGK73728.1 hypothetical protein EHQ27_06560 [Leptospira wolffii]TGL27640.1 hypothetical protein EHQ57_14755 [Leptospira wolffii]